MRLPLFGAKRLMKTVRRPARLVALTGLAVAAIACSYNPISGESEVHGMAKFKLPVFPETGSHAFVVFTEMHYQPAYRAQEVPRLLPPEDSVPITGKEITFRTIEEYGALPAGASAAGEYGGDHAAFLYVRNCQVCHGAGLRGDGAIRTAQSSSGQGLAMNRGPFPADLTLEVTQTATVGEIYAFITFGGRQGFAAYARDRRTTSPMPPYHHLLSENDRWALSRFILDH